MSAVADMIGAMEAQGVRPLEPIAQRLAGGSLIRFRADGDKPGRRNGWAVLFDDGTPAGAFGCYRLGIAERWCARSRETLSPAERSKREAAWRRAATARQSAIEDGWRAAAKHAARLLGEASPADPRHPYLSRKRIEGEGIKQRGPVLLVPMRDAEGAIWNVQRIDEAGSKRFLYGGRTTGLLWRCGEPDAVMCVGEGMATMAVVRRATGHAVAASFSEKNLEPVTRAMARSFPDIDLIVCADDDAHLVDHPVIKRNLGLDAARAAAAAVGARVAVPTWS